MSGQRFPGDGTFDLLLQVHSDKDGKISVAKADAIYESLKQARRRVEGEMRQKHLQKIHCVNCGHLFQDHFQIYSGNLPKVGGCEMEHPRPGYSAGWKCSCRTFEFPPAEHSPEVEASKEEFLGSIPRPECANCGHDYGLHVEITPFEGMRMIGCQHLDISLEFQGKECECEGYEPMTKEEPTEPQRCGSRFHPEDGPQCALEKGHLGRHRDNSLYDTASYFWTPYFLNWEKGERESSDSSNFPNFEERARHTIEKVVQSLLDLLSNIKGSSEKIG